MIDEESDDSWNPATQRSKELDFMAYMKDILDAYESGEYTVGEAVNSIGHKFVKTVVPDYKDGDTVKLKFRQDWKFLYVGDSCDEQDVEDIMDS